MKMLFRFDDALPQQPIPVFATEPDGSPRESDGNRFFNLAQAAERAGVDEQALSRAWTAFAREVAGDALMATEVVRDNNTGEERQLDFADLSETEIRERAERRLRGSEFTLDEMAAFKTHAEAMGYDVAIRECYPKRVVNPDTGRAEIVCLAKIEALERRVLASGLFNGQLGPWYSDDKANWSEYWDGEKPPAFCKVELFRHGTEKPLTVVVSYSEFVKFDDDDNPLPPDRFWRVKYCVCLSRCARAKGFRELFRDVIGAVYIAEEINDGGGSRRRRPRPSLEDAIRSGAASLPEPPPGPRPVAYAPDAEFCAGGVNDETIHTERGCRNAMTKIGTPATLQDRLIGKARQENATGEDDGPDAFWGAIFSEARRLSPPTRRAR